MIGSQINVRAMVIRVSEVKPMISMACYLCEICGYEMYQPVHGRNYNPLTDCISPECVNNNNRGRIIPNFSVSKFVPFQELKIQETSDQCPMGSIPRSFTVHAKGSMTRQCTPGDIVQLSGIYLPMMSEKKSPDSLVHETHIEAHKIVQEKKKYSDLDIPDVTMSELQAEANTENILSRLTRSISPEIYGMEHVKKAL